MAYVVRPERPGSVTTLAVFQLIVGGVGLIYELIKGAGTLLFVVNPSMVQLTKNTNPAVGVILQVPYFTQLQLAACLMGLILSVALIADGVGLLMMRRWAYSLGVVYGWLSIAYQAAWMVYLLVVVQPAVMAGLDTMPVPPTITMPPQTFRDVMKGASLFDTVMTGVGLTYPIFVLIFLAMVRNTFRRAQAAPAGGEDSGFGAAETDVPEGRRAGNTDLPPGYEPDDRFGSGQR